MQAVRSAHAANNPEQWAAERARLEGALGHAERCAELARTTAGDLTADARQRFDGVTAELDGRRGVAKGLSEPPSGFTVLSNEAEILAACERAPDEGAHAGFERQEAELKAGFDRMAPAERRTLVKRIQRNRANDPVAATFMRFTEARRTRLVEYLATAPKRDALLRAAVLSSSPSSLVVDETRALSSAGLAATFEKSGGSDQGPAPADARLRGILEAGEPEAVLELRVSELSESLDEDERRQLVQRIETYRPGSGDEVAARVARLDAGPRQRIVDKLGKAPMSRKATAATSRGPVTDALPSLVVAAPSTSQLAKGGTVIQLPATQTAAPPVTEAIESVRVVAEAAYLQLVEIDVRRASADAKHREEAAKNGGADGDRGAAVVTVRAEDGRDAIVHTVTSALEARLQHARTLYESNAAEPETLRDAIAAASVPVQQIRAWIFLRQNNARLLAAFDRPLSELDLLRQHVGLGPLSKESTQALARVSTEGADSEAREIRATADVFNNAIDAAFVGFTTGADQFKDLSALSRPPEAVAAWKELAKGILTSMLGNLMGPVVGSVLRSHSKLSQAAMDYVAGSTIDSVQSITGTIVDGALQRAENENAMRRDVQLFYQGLVLAEAKCKQVIANSVGARIRTGSISALELEQMTKDVQRSDLHEIALTTFHGAAHGFAQLTAQRSLGVGADKVSQMDGYFGTKEPAMFGDGLGERRLAGNKQGRAGVARLQVEVFDHGTGRVAGTQITKFEIHGMNDDMAAAVLANAGYKLEGLGLPVEVHFAPPWFGRHKPTPMIAIDETGALRATSSWEAFDPEHSSSLSNGGTSRYPQAGNAEFYSTPEKLWAAIRTDSIPKTSVTVR